MYVTNKMDILVKLVVRAAARDVLYYFARGDRDLTLALALEKTGPVCPPSGTSPSNEEKARQGGPRHLRSSPCC